MSENLRPKKKRKAEKLHLNIKKKWEGLIKGIDKIEVPVTVLDTVEIALIDGTSIALNIKQLLATGSEAEEIEEWLNDKFDDLDEYIVTVDFFVDIDQVANVVQPETDRLLKNL